jgi:hypothetical protein
MKKILFALLLLFGLPSMAEPTRAEAEKWYEEFRSAKDKVFDGLFITKTDQHLPLTKRMIELNRRAEKLFGLPMTSELANCTIVAINLQTIWGEIADLARTSNLKREMPAFLAAMAWSGGEKYPTCLAEIDKLK